MSNPPNLIVSVSGVRGIVGRELTASVAMRFAQAWGSYLKGGTVAVSRDSRPSGEMLYEAVAAGLMSVGCNVYFLSINPTPTVGFITRRLEAAGAVQITASHNPAEYNGLKLFGSNGAVLPTMEGERVLQAYQRETYPLAEWHNTGRTQTVMFDPSREHIRQVLAQLDCDAIVKRHFRILVDANHGAGGPLALILGATLGCQVIRQGCEPDGQFAHPPEPTEASVSQITQRVVEEKCNLGIVLDPDADRLALIDEKGCYVGEEMTLGLVAAYRLRQARGPIVVNMSTSRLVEDLAALHDCPFFRSAVGEANVVAKMNDVGAMLGGEGNGGVIDPRVGLVRDPFIGLGVILAFLAETGMALSDLVGELPRYYIVKSKQTVDRAKLRGVYKVIEQKWPDAEVNREDGLRLDWPDRWVHVRPSNTEPIVRVIAEARVAERAANLCREIGMIVGAIEQDVTRKATGGRRRSKVRKPLRWKRGARGKKREEK